VQGTGHRCLRAHIAAEQERQAKTDACLVPLCPLASMVPVFLAVNCLVAARRGSGRLDPVGEISKPIPPPGRACPIFHQD
jgi:hypothetical protein